MFRSHRDVKFKETEMVNNAYNEAYYCDLCEQGPWLSELDVEIHRKGSHKCYIINSLKDESGNMCSICLREQTDKQALIEHIIVYHLCSSPNSKQLSREIFICDYCHYAFFNKKLLMTHIYHWHNKTNEGKPEKINCPKCCKHVRGKSIWFHLLYHGMYNIGTCPICLKNCHNSSQLMKHLKTHPGHFLCSICGYETTKECYFTNHLEKHKKNVKCDGSQDVSRFFLPQKMNPSLKNRMINIFKGIPLTNAVRICILCRALCVSNEEMVQHIFGDHAPEVEAERKTYRCMCGEEFFNNVLLKHHIFKMKGDHRVWDGVSPFTQPELLEEEVVYVFEINEPDSEIIIAGLPDQPVTEVTHCSEEQLIINDFEQMES